MGATEKRHYGVGGYRLMEESYIFQPDQLQPGRTKCLCPLKRSFTIHICSKFRWLASVAFSIRRTILFRLHLLLAGANYSSFSHADLLYVLFGGMGLFISDCLPMEIFGF